jgi:ParB family transcriptional regulator, chromosome partitioning protein
VAGRTRIPAVIRHTDDGDLLKEALIENIHRVQLNPLEEGAAYQQLLEDFGVTQEELAQRLGKSRPTITNALRLLTLPPAVQRRVAAGVLSAGHAKAVLALPDRASQEGLADRIVAEGLSVRATEEVVRLRLLDDGDADAGRESGGASGSGRTAGRGSNRRVTAPGLVELQDDLSDALNARVKITMGARKGTLRIDFGSVDDLERIVGVVARGLQTDISLGD